MGFGQGVGFTKRAVSLFASYLLRSGGGQAFRTETPLLSTVTNPTGGGGLATETETPLTETVVLSLGSL